MASKRRGNNEGSITMRKTCINCGKVNTSSDAKTLTICKHCEEKLPTDGTWAGQVSTGYDTVTGKPLRKTFYGATRAEVNTKMTNALQEVQTGTYVQPTKTTLGEWLDKWLVDYKKGQLKRRTYESYKELIDLHIKPGIGAVQLSKLQANTLQSFYNEKLEAGRKDGKGALSSRTVKYFHTVIRQALQQAAKEGLIIRNVADATSPPVIKNKPMQPLTESELLTFLNHAKEDRLYAAYVTAAFTGLRRGELLGLTWNAVDLENGTINVMRQLLTLKSGLLFEETPKTKGGKRSIILTDDNIKELKAHKRRQAEEKLAMGEAYQKLNLVFCKEDGSPTGPNEFAKHFQKLLVDAGLPKVRLHDLRHTHATILLQRGVAAKMVQERLGHSSITMTLDLYSHVTPEMAKMAAESLNGFLSQEKSSVKAQSE